jgi:hypothetical protein
MARLDHQTRLKWRGLGRLERNKTARSFRQLRRFHHGINSDEVFGTHKSLLGTSALGESSGMKLPRQLKLRLI